MLTSCAKRVVQPCRPFFSGAAALVETARVPLLVKHDRVRLPRAMRRRSALTCSMRAHLQTFEYSVQPYVKQFRRRANSPVGVVCAARDEQYDSSA